MTPVGSDSHSHSLCGLLFLSGFAAMPAACAKGTEERAKTPPFAPTAGGDDGGGRDSFDPFSTSGELPDSGESSPDSDDPAGPGPTQGEGETGVVSSSSGKDEGTGLPDSTDGDPSDSASTGGAVETTHSGEAGESTGDTEGYDPCPYVADLYAACIESVTYENELDYCQSVLQAAYDDAPACGMAFGDYLACLSFLDCATLLAKGVPTECAAEHAVVQSACNN